MIARRLSNTDQIKGTDRQASGSQPDNSTPTGTTSSGISPPGTGTVTSVGAAARGIVATPDPITGAGTIGWANPDVVDVRDYGMDPANSAADNTTGWNAAVAALASYGTLYLPGGRYPVNFGSLASLTGLTGITVCGDGWSSELYSAATGASGNCLVIDQTCDHVTVREFSIQGSATVRGNGIGIRCYASDVQIVGMRVSGMSDFGMHVDGDGTGTAYSERVQVVGNTVYACLGDGIHTDAAKDVLVSANIVRGNGDDSIAFVATDASFPTMRFTCVGNHIYDGGFRGIAVLEGEDFIVASNFIDTTVSAGIELNRFNSTTAYNTHGSVVDNTIINGATATGPIGVINLFWCERVKCSGNLIDSPGFATVSGIAYLDVLAVSITDNHIVNSQEYGIRGYDFGASHVAASQGPLTIKGNFIDTAVDYAIYAVADTGATINNLFCNENETVNISGANVGVFYDRITTGTVINNYVSGAAITAGGTVSGVTATPNY